LGAALPISVADPEFLLAMKKTGAVPALKFFFRANGAWEKRKMP
jgi:hypothetical protein